MAQAGMPNPIELYEGARDYMLPILGAVESSHLTNATPCAEWNVKQLINHNLLVTEVVYRLLTGREMVNPFAVDKDLPEEGAKEAFRVATDRVLSAIKQPKAPEEVISTPFGEMPAGDFLLFPFGYCLGNFISSRLSGCVSIERMVQQGREASSEAPVQVVMLTHEAREANVRHALREIQMLSGIVEPSRALRIEPG